ncbi:ferrous iron transporter C [Ventosimonas gracilis]|uniref:Ferrous iron transporter C n=1 Tax=Ventosimonas gracilis TaxID=1680762 RepID=A0A139SND7_9GAMM|nr:EAL domain-containing protein [Ventosimonas gracilis]KXU36143.1 ferrous iron transporter C [Ventosimonas gracilis]
MNHAKRATSLLLVEDSQNEAERIANLFRAGGRSVRVQRVDCPEQLQQSLMQSWDLLICAPACEQISAEQVAALLSKRSRDIPLIQLVEQDSGSAVIVEALERGARGVVAQGEDRMLLLIASRELANLRDRRALHAALEAHREAEKRCQLLLESSQDAIAYIHDGMHIYGNQSWRQRFAYESAEELEGMPIIDLIAQADQAKFKAFFKEASSEQEAELQLTAVTSSGKPFAAKMVFSPARWQGEACTQVIIRSEHGDAELEAKLKKISSQDLTTGLFNHNHFLKLLEKTASSSTPAAVAYLRIDHYSDLLTSIGLSGVEQLVISLAELLRGHFDENVSLARFADNAFSLLQTGITAPQMGKSLNLLLKEVSSRLFDVGGRTVQTSFSIGLVGLAQDSAEAVQVMERARQCASAVAQGNGLKCFDPSEELAARAGSGDIVALLQQAFTSDGFRLLFQPLVSLRGASDKHYEVLLRLKTAQGEEISPLDFLPVAEQAGLLGKIDRWVILNAIKRQRSAKDSPCLFIHLSPINLQDQSLLPWLASVINAAKLPKGRLIFQLNTADTEQWIKQTQTLIGGLHALHCKVALANFDGSARQFALFKHLDADFIKLGSSLSQDLDEAENQQRLKALLDKLAEQNKQSIVPFVETVGVLSLLWQAGAHYIQGYYLQAPNDDMNYDFTAS